jgi:mycothiol system anti-sigma-R factor
MSRNFSEHSITCQELETFLYAYLDREFEPGEQTEIESHLAECADCAHKVHQEAAFREALRQKTRELMSDPAMRAPEALRQSIQSRLRQAQQRASLRGWIRASAAAVVIAAAGGAYVFIRTNHRERFVEDAAMRHAKALPFEIQRMLPEHYEAWFEGKLDHRVRVPQLPNATLAGARLTNVRDKSAAYIGYNASDSKASQRRIGLFVFRDEKNEVEATSLPGLDVDPSHGYNVAVWRDRELIYELVSDLDEEDIRQMVSAAHASSRVRPHPPEMRIPIPSSTPLPQPPSLVQPASVQH